jgi:hypothetical protein
MRPVADEDRTLDLLAASLRADSRDLSTFVEVLATKLARALPERVEVERSGILAGRRVRRLVVRLDDDVYVLEQEHGRLECGRKSVVRGITLKNEDLSLDEWIDDLSRSLAEEGRASERGRVALERLLGAG